MKTHQVHKINSTGKAINDPLAIRKILELWDDGYTVHEISESLAGVHCTEIAQIISQAIRDEAERCA